MQLSEVSGAVRPLYGSLGDKGLNNCLATCFAYKLWLSGTDVSYKPASYILKFKIMSVVLAEILVHMFQIVRRRIPESRHINDLTFFEGRGCFKMRN